MEFVIAQERTKSSSFVLSEFMGISQHMADALQVNPWDLGMCCERDVAAAMNRGLVISEEEKASRHAALHKVVTTHTSHTWAAVHSALCSMRRAQASIYRTPKSTVNARPCWQWPDKQAVTIVVLAPSMQFS
ncbi:glycosyltransferase family 20-domain-containing protein [Suillus clintonianus]|uniref:glycosyltransferase family 20-domain-containing protein n=1 Tax=Suillus clintonianus TaxID=1904413 RepID=UPI001B88190B|nr:glycosyltransferase family 20-domain-containing protein [Suillus clintonianus]KAG2132110.1 glycosyltransferase family 20-domain-containing protein [Suillus clintonianus]